MLIGTYIKDERIYNISAYDYGSTITLQLSCPVNKNIKYIDGGILLPDGDIITPKWEELYMSIGSSNITVDQASAKEDGVVCKTRLNEEFFCSLGSILQGMRLSCISANLVKDYLELYQTEFNPMRVQEYKSEYGVVKSELGVIKKVVYDGPLGSLSLEDDGKFSRQMFPQERVKRKIKLDLSDFVSTPENSDDWDFKDANRVYTLAEIIERNPHKNYAWIEGRKYTIVKTIDRVEKICKEIWNHKGIVAFDTETTGLNVTVKSRVGQADRLLGMVFSIKPGEAYYFPIAHTKFQNICTAADEYHVIEKYFKPILEKKDLLCHNGSYDWKVMHIYDICLNLVQDTYILFKLTLWNDHTDMELGLKPLTSSFLNRDSFELSDFVDGKFGSNDITFLDLEEESVKDYACPDADNSLELYLLAVKEMLLEKYDAKKIYEIEVRFSLVIAYQEFYGHCVRIEDIDALVEGIHRDMSTNYASMVELVGHDFNPASSKDLRQVMYKELNYPVFIKTESGEPSTNKDTLEKLMSYKNLDDSPIYPFAEYLRVWRDAKQLESNFTKNIDTLATPDGLMFSEIQQFLATGRVSSKKPNYQGYNNTVKKYIIPREGYYALDADYSSVEARILCSMANCTEIVEKLRDPDMDYHRIKASDMFSVPYELVTPDLRSMAKGVNFGILYGLGDPNLGSHLFGSVSPENTRKAIQQKQLYFKGMEGLKPFIDVSQAQGVNQNYSTTYFKRRRYYDPRKVSKSKIGRQSGNARIQGTAADLYKLAMVRLFTEVKNRGLMGRILISAFIHDECFLEVHKSIDPAKMLKLLRECMMVDIEGWCPLFIGAGFGRHWYEAKKTEIPIQVQETIVNNWGESGLDWWNGDTDKLLDWEQNEILRYKQQRVYDYMSSEDNTGKVLSPVINDLCKETLQELKSGSPLNGKVYEGVSVPSDMIERLKEFCRVFDCLDLYEKRNIQKPVVNSTKKVSLDDLDEEEEETDIKEITVQRVNMLGALTRVEPTLGKRVIYFKLLESNPMLMKLVYNIIQENKGDCPVYAVKNDGELYSTGLYTSSKIYTRLLQLYVHAK